MGLRRNVYEQNRGTACEEASDQAGNLYLDLLRKVLTREVAIERYRPLQGAWGPTTRLSKILLAILRRPLESRNLEIVRRYSVDWKLRDQGKDWPPDAETMVGAKRLKNVQACITSVVRDGVPGDLIETGVWRGGCSIFMRAVLSVLGDATRVLWVADSFEGLPRPDADKYPRDAGDKHWTFGHLAVSLEEVKANFRQYGCLDDHVRFLKGWFKDTLPAAPIARLAVVRLDGDMYESTSQAIDALYPKLSIGGYIIIDDYGLSGCKAAVDDYRRTHAISEEIQPIDGSGVYWRRLR